MITREKFSNQTISALLTFGDAQKRLKIFTRVGKHFAFNANIQQQPNRVLNQGGGPDVSTGVGTVQVGWLQTGHLREKEEQEEEEEEGTGRCKESVFTEASERLSSTGPSVLS